MKVKVTQKDIDGADGSCWNCMVARALSRRFPWGDVTVGFKTVGITYRKKRHYVHLPPTVTKRIYRLVHQGPKKIKPFSFELEVSA